MPKKQAEREANVLKEKRKLKGKLLIKALSMKPRNIKASARNSNLD